MNRIQKISVLIVALVILVMMLFPPYYYKRSYLANAGYAFILCPPQADTGEVAMVNVPVLFMQLFVSGVLFLAVKNAFKPNEPL